MSIPTLLAGLGFLGVPILVTALLVVSLGTVVTLAVFMFAPAAPRYRRGIR